MTQARPKRILLVDDEPFLRLTVRRMLQSLGELDVREAADGTAALDVINAGFRPDVILCDVNMAPMDGLTFLRHLRESPDAGHAATPVIIMTGAADQSLVRATIEFEDCTYLRKPIPQGPLLERLNDIFRRE